VGFLFFMGIVRVFFRTKLRVSDLCDSCRWLRQRNGGGLFRWD
jgi:hypothetical protein